MSQAHDPFLSHTSSASDSDEHDHSPPPDFYKSIRRTRSRRRRNFFTAISVGYCLITGWIMGLATSYAFKILVPEPDIFHPDTLAKGINLCDCGDNVKDALRRGCVYDTLSTSWLPPFCRDPELTAKFDKSGDDPNGEWSYYADQEGTYRLSVDEIALLGKIGGHFWASRY